MSSRRTSLTFAMAPNHRWKIRSLNVGFAPPFPTLGLTLAPHLKRTHCESLTHNHRCDVLLAHAGSFPCWPVLSRFRQALCHLIDTAFDTIASLAREMNHGAGDSGRLKFAPQKLRFG